MKIIFFLDVYFRVLKIKNYRVFLFSFKEVLYQLVEVVLTCSMVVSIGVSFDFKSPVMLKNKVAQHINIFRRFIFIF